jgi:hypothetical protein
MKFLRWRYSRQELKHMRMMDRRDFLKRTAQTAAGISAATFGPDLSRAESGMNLQRNEITAIIPMPIQVVIDDVGWWSGRDGSQDQEPYRTGIPRNHVPEDYDAIVQFGSALDIRPQAAMVLCEWDKKNILRKLPTSTWMGSNWDNTKWIGPWMEKAADIIRRNRAYFELTLHGVGHEFWMNGKFTRAEWADTQGVMRPADQVESHLDAFEALLNQHQLGPMPSSFVPTAFLHGFGPANQPKMSIANILSRRGINYINTPFESMRNREAAEERVFGFDEGVMTIDRGHDLLNWNIIGQSPTGELRGPTCGMHWANLLHTDPARNSEIVDGWVKLLQPFKDSPDRWLAANSESFRSQLIHHTWAKLYPTERGFRLDFTKVDALSSQTRREELVIKLKSPYPLRLSSESIGLASRTVVKRENFLLYSFRLTRLPDLKVVELKVCPEGE